MLTWSRAAAIASNIARCVRGPSTRRRAWLPPTNGFSGGTGRVAEPAFGGDSAHAGRTASPAARTAQTAKRASTLPLDANVVLDRAHALHLLRRRDGASRLVFRVDEAGQLDHPAIGLDVDRGRGPRPGCGGDRALPRGRDRRVVGELAGAAPVAIVRRRAGAEAGECGGGEARREETPPGMVHWSCSG